MIFLKNTEDSLAKLSIFLDELHNIIDVYSHIYDNHIVLGDFSLDPSNTQLPAIMESYNYYNLIKQHIFKGSGLT